MREESERWCVPCGACALLYTYYILHTHLSRFPDADPGFPRAPGSRGYGIGIGWG